MERTLGFICGAATSLLLLIVILKLTKKDGSIKCKFDERQLLVRGKGFKYGFFTLAVCNTVYGLLDAPQKYMENMTAMMLGLMISAVVYASYCIWNEGYVSLNENPKRVYATLIFISLLNYLVCFNRILENEFIVEGVLQISGINLFCAAATTIIVIELAVKSKLNREDD